MSSAERRAEVAPCEHVDRIVAYLKSHRDPLSVPIEARQAAKKFLFDSVGVALAGTTVSESDVVRRVVSSWGEGSDATVWGSHEKLPAPSAAMVNAFHIHNQEFDCVHEKAVVHPMAVILAALMAYAERNGQVTGTKFLAALAIAVDVATVIGMTATKPIRFFRPAQCGCLGAAVGMAYLAEMDEGGIKNTLGLAYSQLAGTMQAHIEGTPALALQVAFAARSAVNAVDLAILGFRAPHDVLDGKYGYFALIEDGAANVAPFAALGKVWQITRVSHKPYPTGRAAQGAISGLQQLQREHGFIAADVQRVELHAPPLIRQLVDRPYRDDMPVNYARLCVSYLLAVTLRDGTVGLDAYRETNLRGGELKAIAAKVVVAADGNADPNALAPQSITIVLNDGRIVTAHQEYIYGSPEAPMTIDAQRDKFIGCCRNAKWPLDDASIAALSHAIHHIEQTSDASAIVRLTIAR
jgi:2-methylcitrate dehydratase PrpD